MGKCVYKKSCIEAGDGFYVHYELKITEGSGFDLIITKLGHQIKHHFISTAEYKSLIEALDEFGFAINCELNGAPMVDYLTEEEYAKL